jgi:hypothetical protein
MWNKKNANVRQTCPALAFFVGTVVILEEKRLPCRSSLSHGKLQIRRVKRRYWRKIAPTDCTSLDWDNNLVIP